MKIKSLLISVLTLALVSGSLAHAQDSRTAENLAYLNAPVARQVTLAGAVLTQIGISTASMGVIMRMYPGMGAGVHTAGTMAVARAMTNIGLAGIAGGALLLIREFTRARAAHQSGVDELAGFFALPASRQLELTEQDPALAQIVDDLADYLRAHDTKK